MIAGKGVADFNSFKEAVYLDAVYHSRNQYAEISKTTENKEKQL
jgi:4-hydroxythreonine-4-phosphate dehydrogenase